jgi:hypothetical protein
MVEERPNSIYAYIVGSVIGYWVKSGTLDTFYLKSGVLKYNLTVPVNLLVLLDCT